MSQTYSQTYGDPLNYYLMQDLNLSKYLFPKSKDSDKFNNKILLKFIVEAVSLLSVFPHSLFVKRMFFSQKKAVTYYTIRPFMIKTSDMFTYDV